MTPRAVAVVLVAAAVVGVVDDAEARRRRRSHTTRRKPARPANMPPAWTWPPSAAMRAAGKQCTADLDRLGVRWRAAKAQRKVATPIVVRAMTFGGVKLIPTFRKPPFVMDCQLARALEHHGRALYAQGIRELHFSRIYGYTPVRTQGTTKAALSRHALGLAIDVRAIVDDTGRKAVVLDDYNAGDALLHQVEQYLNASGGFRTVLTPGNDPQSHYDHFHVEASADFRAPPRPKRRRP